MTSSAVTEALMLNLENGDGLSTDVSFTFTDDLAESTSTTIGTPSPRQFKGDRPFLLNGHLATVTVNGWAHPSIAVATLVTNCIVCVVLMRREMRTPTNALLIGMAVSDTLTAVLPLPCFIRFYTLGGYRDWVPYNWCFIWFLLTDYLPTVTHTASIWLTVALAVHRYIVVVRSRIGPRMMSARLRRKTSWKSGTLRSTFIIIVLVYVASFAVHCCRFFEYKYQAVPVLSRIRPLPPPSSSSSPTAAVDTLLSANNDTSRVNGSGDGALFSSRHHHQLPVVVGCRYDLIPFISQYADVYYATYYWTRIVVVHLVPCVSLVILNAALVRTMVVAEQRRKQLTRRRSTGVSGSTNSDVMSTAIFSTMGGAMAPRRRRRLSEGNATTLMLVAVVGLLLIVEVPLAVLLAIVLIENTFQILIISVRSTLLSTIFVNFLVLLSYPLNFFVYCAMSQKFREAFWRMFGVNDACQRIFGNHVTLRCCCRRSPDETSPDATGTCRSTPV